MRANWTESSQGWACRREPAGFPNLNALTKIVTQLGHQLGPHSYPQILSLSLSLRSCMLVYTRVQHARLYMRIAHMYTANRNKGASGEDTLGGSIYPPTFRFAHSTRDMITVTVSTTTKYFVDPAFGVIIARVSSVRLAQE